jgi:hypothetical protein
MTPDFARKEGILWRVYYCKGISLYDLVTSSAIVDAMSSHRTTLRILQLWTIGDRVPKPTTYSTSFEIPALRHARVLHRLQECRNPENMSGWTI